jgi:hypothetical protein
VKVIRSFASNTAKVSGLVSGSPVFMVEVNGEVLLPVQPGRSFGLRLTNTTDKLRAFPAVVGDGETWTNVYEHCAILNPSLMPSSGGMWETRARGSHDLDAFALPQSQERPFIAEMEGDGYLGLGATQIVVWERPPVDPNAVINEPPAQVGGALGALLGNSGFQSRGATRGGPVIGAGAAQSDARIVSNLDYLEATKLAHVRIVTRDEVTKLAKEHGIVLTGWSVYDLANNEGEDFPANQLTA